MSAYTNVITTMTHTRKGLAVLGGIAALLIMLLAIAPVHAVTYCNGSGWLCAWENADRGGNTIQIYQPPSGVCVNLPSAWWDKISSVENLTSTYVEFYTQTNCGGWHGLYCAGCYANNLSGSGLNDEFRSYRKS